MKKFIKPFIIATCALFYVVSVAGCVPQGLEAHTWSDDWASNSKTHWHRCLDASCNGRSEYGEHEWELTDIYEEATCGETGLGQYTCSVCKATMGNRTTPATVPATGKHSYKLDTVDVEPSCGEEGYASYICEVCYDYTVSPIPATGEHDYSGNYEFTGEGHYHVCLHGCGVNEEIQPHTKGEGKRIEPSGMRDGRIEYRCTVCNYLMDSEVIVNPNVLHHFEAKFVKGSNEIIPQLGEDGELYVTLSTSSNASNGYKIELSGYTVEGNPIDVPNVKYYYYNEFTAEKIELTLGNSATQRTGYLGCIGNQFYVSMASEGTSLWIECTLPGRDPVALKVHIQVG